MYVPFRMRFWFLRQAVACELAGHELWTSHGEDRSVPFCPGGLARGLAWLSCDPARLCVATCGDHVWSVSGVLAACVKGV